MLNVFTPLPWLFIFHGLGVSIGTLGIVMIFQGMQYGEIVAYFGILILLIFVVWQPRFLR